MAVAGILTEDDRVELIEGEIVEMPPIGSRHAACVKRLNRLFSSRVGDLAVVLVQDPIRLSDVAEPEPDLALLEPRADFYAAAHPGPAEVLLVVEVADTSVGYDRSVKIPLYARAGIRELWLVDLERERIEVLRQPAAGGYRSVRTYRRGAQLTVEALPGPEFPVDTILG
jgi:Uma2 family endonuclease